jgi:hypothetical protein
VDDCASVERGKWEVEVGGEKWETLSAVQCSAGWCMLCQCGEWWVVSGG